MTEKEKRIAIIAAVIIAILLLFFFVAKKKRSTVVPVYDDEGLDYSLSDLVINLGDLIVPDLTFFRGVTKCGCSGGLKPDAPAAKQQVAAPTIEPIRQGAVPLNYQTPKPAFGWATVAPASNSRIGTYDVSGRYADGSRSSFWG